jgi:hypothetical protein
VPRELRSVFDPLPPQKAFLNSAAKIRGYGGAMGGGKSRTGCEEVFDACLDHPGLVALVARQAHTSIIGTTKKTMLTQVIPPDLIPRDKASQGEDWVELWNGSVIHFVGLDNPTRWFSSEIGYVFFDEAQEIQEDTVVRIMSRLRQPCQDCVREPKYDDTGRPIPCGHMPRRTIITFNPSSPGHWLQQWFLTGEGLERTEYGFRKDKLFPTDAIEPIGDCEFVMALAKDNPFLDEDYMRILRGMPARMRKKYLDGEWTYEEGNQFFDPDALERYGELARDAKPLFNGRTVGDIEKDFLARTRGERGDATDRIRVLRGEGPLTVWKTPVRDRRDEHGMSLGATRYILAVDGASGAGKDFAAIHVISVEDFEQVAEWQAKKTPDETAREAYRLGRIYNNALIVPEVTGGWGFAVQQALQRMHYPNVYTRRIMDRLAKKYTDKLGFDTSERMRAHILDTLERVLREGEFGLYSLRTVNELVTFVINEKGKAEAQSGCNDDLVMSLAIGVTITVDRPRQIRRQTVKPHQAQFSATGY